MTNMYSNGKLYRLVCDDGHYYIGSTTNKLNYCLHGHKTNSKNEMKRGRLYDHILTIGWDKVKIELIELYPCKSKDELTKKMKSIYKDYKDDFMCLNNSELNDSDSESEYENVDYESDSESENEPEDNEESEDLDYESYSESENEPEDLDNEIVPKLKKIVGENKYKHGKIYKIICSDEHYYIGSTIRTLRQRFSHHKKCTKTETSKLYTHLRTIGFDNATIEILELYPCECGKELRKRENDYIIEVKNDPLCLNENRAHVSKEERVIATKKYYEENRNIIINRVKQYREDNYEEVLQKKAAYREQHRAELCEKQKEYAVEHKEEYKQSRKKYNDAHKEHIAEQCRKYNDAHKEQVAAYKLEWTRKKREEVAKATEEERKEKCIARKKKTEERLAQERIIMECECGGTYQPYRKQRHMDSKKHMSFVNK